MILFFVYILHCADNTYYVGMSSNLEKRMKQHDSGYFEGSYTSKRRPVRLIYMEQFFSGKKAFARERQLKRWSSHKKVALAQGNLEQLKRLAACQNLSHYLKRAQDS